MDCLVSAGKRNDSLPDTVLIIELIDLLLNQAVDKCDQNVDGLGNRHFANIFEMGSALDP